MRIHFLVHRAFIIFLFQSLTASGAVHYVNVNSAAPTAPYTSWATAAASIQEAIDASADGDEVLVTNGVYQTGGRVVYGTLTNRVVVDKSLIVRSVNGPAATVIAGNPEAGDNAARCVYLTNATLLAGFTLTAGATRGDGDGAQEQSGGGVFCESLSAVVSNCVLIANSAQVGGGGAYGGTLMNCTLATNTASVPNGGAGGGANSCVLNNCQLTGNSAYYGGAVHACTLTNCTLTANTGYFGGGANASALSDSALTANSALYGGGARDSALTRCSVADNTAGGLDLETDGHGGGADGGTLNNCIVTGNFAGHGGGVYGASLSNCALSGNTAAGFGAGASSCTLSNCTVTGNTSGSSGGGVAHSTLGNCIVYYNVAPVGSNYFSSTLAFSCTQPLPPGPGNFIADPQLASASHLSVGSPCRNAGSSAFADGVDIDGQPWLVPPSVGCDEFYSGGATGALSVVIYAAETNVAIGATLEFAANITGNVRLSRWEFGDGSSLTNLPFTAHSWAVAGNYPVVLRAFSDSFPAGISATTIVHVVVAPVHYVALQNATPVAPFTSWATAATNIQDAIDAAIVGSTILVSNGVYQTGSRTVLAMENRVAVTKAVRVQSLNGPGSVIIDAAFARRGVHLASGATLSGVTVLNGIARVAGGVLCGSATATVSNSVLNGNYSSTGGGGVFGGTLNRSTLSGNTARNGGGAYASTLTFCTISSNTAAYNYGDGQGAGACESTLRNCTVIGNSAFDGGGAQASTLINCAVSGNQAYQNGGGASLCAVRNSTLTGNLAQFGAGGGSFESTNYNSIVFYNSAIAGSNFFGGTLNYCCTLPLAAGTSNIFAEPQLASPSHLSLTSPCRAAGDLASGTGVDIDGEAWLNRPSIGCDEFYSGASSGPLAVSFQVNYTNVAINFSALFTGSIEGYCSASRWEFGDGTIISNRPYAPHAWAAAGDYSVVLRAFNGTFPGGVSATQTVHVVPGIIYVFATNSTPVAPFATWATAATNIQDALDVAGVGVTVTVSNGFYRYGGRSVNGTSNRVAIVTPLVKLQSVNGAAATIVSGGGEARCAYLLPGALLNGFTLTNGSANDAGGVHCEAADSTVLSCVIVGNFANSTGGGVIGGSLSNCTINANNAFNGGGAYASILQNCRLTGNGRRNTFFTTGGGLLNCTATDCYLTNNWGWYGGGANACTFNNSVFYRNEGGNTGGGATASTLNNCLLIENTTSLGGGMNQGAATNCTFVGNTSNFGGAANATTLVNCLLTGNQSSYGGGGNSCLLINCRIFGNFCYNEGGGANSCDLVNCVVIGNTSNGTGGGVNNGTIRNTIVYFNTSSTGANWFGGEFDYSCTTPLPASGIGNFANNPLLVNQPGGNFRLQSTSPCINAGRNAYANAGPDLDGNPRVIGGTVDVGAYEYPAPTSLISYEWLQRFGLPLNGSVDFIDSDGDGHTTWQEWRADTIPNNALSVLHLTGISDNAPGASLTWQSVPTRTYFLERASSPAVPLSFSVLATNIAGQAGFTTYLDADVAGPGAFLYRVGVHE